MNDIPARIPVKPEWRQGAVVDSEAYARLYQESLAQPEQFWALQAEQFLWRRRWDSIMQARFTPPVEIAWFGGAELNLCENCLDRHLATRGEQLALIWEGDSPEQVRRLTYRQLFEQVCRLSNVLKAQGVKKGDRVTLYLPMIPEAMIAMLACARIGAVHSVVFAGFSPEALKGRIEDCGSTLVLTADEGWRGGKKIPLKANVDAALAGLGGDVRVLVVRHTGGAVDWVKGQDQWFHEQMAQASADCPPEVMAAEDPLFILYTSGSTGKPKGVLHSTAGYMVWAALTFKTTFDYRDGELFWCTADVGWVTGHSYCVYGPLLNGATTLMFEGVPNYPDWARFWQIIDRYQVNIFYTAPTAIRALMREGDGHVTGSSRASLRLLGSVGEPINPEAWWWFYRVVGEERCPLVDTWWQTETGGHMLTPLPGATDLKPGSAAKPFFGVKPVIVNGEGTRLEGACEGMLCIEGSWPGQARSLYGDHTRFEQTYFSTYPGLYFTGDGARRDEDGYYWITGRVDDVLNVSGHRLGTAEIENLLSAHPSVAEAAVVGFPHDIKGQGIYAYVVLNEGKEAGAPLQKELTAWVRTRLSPIATPDRIHFASVLPKTRSGKIMRRILRKIAEGEKSNFGDVSTLTNPEVVEELVNTVP